MARTPAAPVEPPRPGAPVALVAAVVAVVVALVAVVGYLAVRDDDPQAQGDPLVAEGGANTLPAGGGVVVGPDPPQDVPQVVVYEDFQCPFCADLESSVGAQLAQRAQDGEIALSYVLMSFLDERLDNDSSTRAANAAVCAADADAFSDWQQTAFAAQPQEGAGFTDARFVEFAEQAGLAGADLESFATCATDGDHLDYVADMQEASARAEVTGTPTIVVDGEPLDSDALMLLMTDPTSLDTVLEDAS